MNPFDEILEDTALSEIEHHNMKVERIILEHIIIAGKYETGGTNDMFYFGGFHDTHKRHFEALVSKGKIVETRSLSGKLIFKLSRKVP